VALIKEKISWILRKQKEILENEKKIVISKPEYATKSTLPYLGKNYNVEIKFIDSKGHKEQNEKNNLVFEDGQFLFTINSLKVNQNYDAELKKLHEDWLFDRAETIFKEKIDILSKKVGVKPSKLVVKNLRNRWGSITKSNEINLNVNLIKAPEEVVDYIILHELCHFHVKGHSYRFWNLLKNYSPDYPKYVEWLKINGKLMSNKAIKVQYC